MKNKITLIAASTLFLISCGDGTEGTPVEKTGTTVNNSNGTEEKRQGLNFKAGEEVKLGDFVIKVNKVEEFRSTDEFAIEADNGMKLVAIEVEYNNPTTDKQLNSGTSDWSASDNEGYSYEYDLMRAKEPMLDDKTLNPGGKVKGWLTFQIPKANQLTKVQFQPDFLDNANVEFELK